MKNRDVAFFSMNSEFIADEHRGRMRMKYPKCDAD
jgi:hypothetical protein